MCNHVAAAGASQGGHRWRSHSHHASRSGFCAKHLHEQRATANLRVAPGEYRPERSNPTPTPKLWAHGLFATPPRKLLSPAFATAHPSPAPAPRLAAAGRVGAPREPLAGGRRCWLRRALPLALAGRESLVLDADPDSVDGMASHEIFVDNDELRHGFMGGLKDADAATVEARRPLREALQQIMRPILDERVTPFVRQRFPEQCGGGRAGRSARRGRGASTRASCWPSRATRWRSSSRRAT